MATPAVHGICVKGGGENLRCQNDASRLGGLTPANKLPLTGELTLPGKIILEAEASDVIFLTVDGGRPIKFKNRTPAGGSGSSVTE